jgi:hypothetical protein
VVGDIGTDRVALTWEPPYDRVKTYKVYIKKNDKDRYELADSTGGRSVTLKGLTSNTGYFMIVTSVDTANYESSPSNELQVRTKNMPPDEPDRVLYTLDATGTRKVTWKPARDPDGTVVKYRIYTRHGGEKKLLKETKTGTCTAGPEVTEKIYVCAVDNMGDESGLVRASKLCNMKTYVSVLADGLMPLAGFGDTAGPGPGVTLQFGREACFFEGLVLGAEAGFYTFTGKSSEFKDTGLSYMASLLLTAGYRFEMNYYFSLTPYLALGAAWFQSDLTNRDEVTLNESKESVSEIGPVMAAGFTGAYRLNESVSLLLRFCSGYLAGSDSGLYAGCALGCMYRL